MIVESTNIMSIKFFPHSFTNSVNSRSKSENGLPKQRGLHQEQNPTYMHVVMQVPTERSKLNRRKNMLQMFEIILILSFQSPHGKCVQKTLPNFATAHRFCSSTTTTNKNNPPHPNKLS